MYCVRDTYLISLDNRHGITTHHISCPWFFSFRSIFTIILISVFSELCPRHVSTFFDNHHVLTLFRSFLSSPFSSFSSSLVSQTARSCVNCVHDTCLIFFDNHHVLTLIRSSLSSPFSPSPSSLVSCCEVSTTRV